MKSRFRDIQRADEARPGFPGEHWLVAAAGVYAWRASRRHSSAWVRAFGPMVAAALLARAASGRDGAARLLRPA